MVPKFSLKFSYFEIENSQMIWDGEMAKPNDVDLKELYIFVVDNFSI